jgi:hypothetical protein
VTSRVAFGLMVVLTLLFGLFSAGYAWEDLGFWRGTATVLVVVIPLVLLTFVAYLWPSVATWLLAVGLVIVAVLAVLDSQGEAGREVVAALGPIAAVSILMLGVPMATLGLTRPLTGGLLLVGTSLAAYLPYVPFVVRNGVALGASLTWSSTVLVVPFLVIGLVFLLAALLNRGEVGAAEPTPQAPKPPLGAGV